MMQEMARLSGTRAAVLTLVVMMGAAPFTAAADCPPKKAFSVVSDAIFVSPSDALSDTGITSGVRPTAAEAATFCRYEPRCSSWDSRGGYTLGPVLRDTQPAPGVCSYLKDTCPPVSGFTAHADVDIDPSPLPPSSRLSGNCFADVHKACEADATCLAFNKMRYVWSTATTTPAAVISNLFSMPGSCIYVRTQPPPPPSPRPPSPFSVSVPPLPPPVCDASEWDCAECTRRAADAAPLLGTGLALPCQQCEAKVDESYNCLNCFATAPNRDVFLGCLSCAAAEGGSGCSQVCAAKATDAATMAGCANCTKREGNAWDCGTCFEKSGGDAAKRSACFTCIGDEAGSYACGECTSRYSSLCEVKACMDCLRRDDSNAYECYTATNYCLPPSPPAPPPAACPASSYNCAQCTTLASSHATTLGSGLAAPCQQCVLAAVDAYDCHNCFSTTSNKDVFLGCLSCAAAGGGSGCSQVCAAKATDAAGMANCANCTKREGNAWDCGTCFEKAGGNVAKRDACFTCIGDRADTYGCQQCTSRYSTLCEVNACMDCLRAGGNPYTCYTATNYCAAATPPAPPPSACPSSKYECAQCTTLAAASAFGAGLATTCQDCVLAVDPYNCLNCFATAPNRDVLIGCLSCAKSGLGSGCSQVCAAKAVDAAAVTECANCTKGGGNAWDCGSCFEKSGGSSSKRNACLRCVRDGAGAFACGECTARYNTLCEVNRCMDCLASGAKAYGCYTASYKKGCGNGNDNNGNGNTDRRRRELLNALMG